MPISPYKTLKENGWNFPSVSEPTLPELFIIESLQEDDENSGFFEGIRIAQILRLGRRNPKYFYVQDERELELLVPVFLQSSYRYLHLSCHGDENGFYLTNGYVSFERFAKMFADVFKLRRLFVSACESGQNRLVEALHNESRGIQSVVAPRIKIDYDHAAAIWSAFYLSLLEIPISKRHVDVKLRISLLVKLFPWADRDSKTEMSFMFAGYASEKDKKGPYTDSWKIENINRSYEVNPTKS